MIESVSNLIHKITGKKPNTEEQSKKFLEDFLKERNMPELGLELRDLLEISIHYTDLTPSISLNSSLMSNFDGEGKLKLPKRTIISTKTDESHIHFLTLLHNHVSPYFQKDPGIRIMKITNGLSFMYKGVLLLKWCQLYFYKEDSIFGTVEFPTDKQFNKLVKGVCSEYTIYTQSKSSITEKIKIDDVITLLNSILERLKENEKGS